MCFLFLLVSLGLRLPTAVVARTLLPLCHGLAILAQLAMAPWRRRKLGGRKEGRFESTQLADRVGEGHFVRNSCPVCSTCLSNRGRGEFVQDRDRKLLAFRLPMLSGHVSEFQKPEKVVSVFFVEPS